MPPAGKTKAFPSGVMPISGGVGSVGMGIVVAVGVKVLVPVPVGVGDSVVVAVGVSTKVVGRVGTSGGMDVSVDAGLEVAVRVGGKYTRVLVGLFATMTVFVTSETMVGAGEAVRVIRGNGVPVTKDAPG